MQGQKNAAGHKNKRYAFNKIYINLHFKLKDLEEIVKTVGLAHL